MTNRALRSSTLAFVHFFSAGTALTAGAAVALAEGTGASTDAEAVAEGTTSADTATDAEAAASDLSSDLHPINVAAQQTITIMFLIVFLLMPIGGSNYTPNCEMYSKVFFTIS